MKEWFKWQATSASNNRRNAAAPYTCPSCRESVRRTKADWRLNTLLEGFLKAHPDKAKSELERKELGELYKPGEDVLPPVQAVQEDNDSEDERLLAQVRELSMSSVGSGARRRAERAADDRRQHAESSGPRLSEARLRAHDADHPQIEHQSSLRSLLSASDGGAQDVQSEILRSIYTEGLLEGVDLDNLTTEQEEELTEKIAEAYRRRQRHGDRSQNRSHHRGNSRSPGQATPGAQSHSPRTAHRDVNIDQQQESRSRPPVSRPNLFEQTLQDPSRTHRRSRSSNSQRSAQDGVGTDHTASATRSVTDLSQQPSSTSAQRARPTRRSDGERSITDPEARGIRENSHQRQLSDRTHGVISNADGPSISQSELDNQPRSDSGLRPPRSSPPPRPEPQRTVRPAVSAAAFAPEPIVDGTSRSTVPSIKCNRCDRPNIEHELHYHCRRCLDGNFNVCKNCYRGGQGCDYWFGFGFRAFERWYRSAQPNGWRSDNRPHVLLARRYKSPHTERSETQESSNDTLQEGAFCENCSSFANDCYWYCNVCLDGAWGFCDGCVKRGKHCTHSLLVVAHISTVHGGHCDPSKLAFVGLPHLTQDTYVNLPVSTGCDICQRTISPNSTRFHCYQCNEGDYDICNECYHGLVSQGKISQANGPNGWRKCLNDHRMVVVGFQDTGEGGHLRVTVRELVGGWALKETDMTSGSSAPSRALPPDGGSGMRCLATYNYFPKDGVSDELVFPKNAEIREVEKMNGDWQIGVYAGVSLLFPSNHVRTM